MALSIRDHHRRAPSVLGGFSGVLLVSSLFLTPPGCGGSPPRTEGEGSVEEAPAASGGAAATREVQVSPQGASTALVPEAKPVVVDGPTFHPLLRGVYPEDALPVSPRRERTQPGTALAVRSQRFVRAYNEDQLLEESEAVWRERRAFDGAPPVMPHSANFGGDRQTCLDCHLKGMSIGERVAHPLSHPPFASCLQCHVESRSANFPRTAGLLRTTNHFRGVGLSGPGERAFEGAPPTIPHSLQMRANCLACHGEYGWPGIRIDHAGRGNCVQCHVPNETPAPGG